MLALPILLLVLLIILRAPVAAVVLPALGGVTTLISFGAMALLGKVIAVATFARRRLRPARLPAFGGPVVPDV